jgi:hypothetical protein
MQNQKESTKVEDGRLLRLTGNLEILHKQQKLAMRRLLLYLSMVRRTILYFFFIGRPNCFMVLARECECNHRNY